MYPALATCSGSQVQNGLMHIIKIKTINGQENRTGRNSAPNSNLNGYSYNSLDSHYALNALNAIINPAQPSPSLNHVSMCHI